MLRLYTEIAYNSQFHTSMKPLELKAKLINIAIHNLEGIILELRGDIKNMLRGEGSTDEGGFNGTKGDFGAVGQENYLREQAQINRREVEKHEILIQQLKSIIIDNENVGVVLGSLVYTNHGNFFISQAIRPIELNKITYLFIGTEAPIYSEMKGKFAGSKFEFRGIEYEIKAVY